MASDFPWFYFSFTMCLNSCGWLRVVSLRGTNPGIVSVEKDSAMELGETKKGTLHTGQSIPEIELKTHLLPDERGTFEMDFEKERHSARNPMLEVNTSGGPVMNSNLRSLVFAFRQPERRYCALCQNLQPYRTKHCSRCQACVAKFDHHCHVIGTCIGELNLRYFWLYLGTQTILFMAIFVNVS